MARAKKETTAEVTRINQDVIISGLNQGQIALITQETPERLIRQRKGRGGKYFDYVPHNFVTELLNEAFNHAWSFECDPILQFCNDKELTVKGKLIVHGKDGKRIIKEQFGQQDIIKNSSGQSVMSFGDALKGAGSDALRKCASLLGIGLDLYGEDHISNEPYEPVPVQQPQPQLLTAKTKKAIQSVIESHIFTSEEKAQAIRFCESNPTETRSLKFLDSLRNHEKKRKQAEEAQETITCSSCGKTTEEAHPNYSGWVCYKEMGWKCDDCMNPPVKPEPEPVGTPDELRKEAALIREAANRSDDPGMFRSEMAKADRLKAIADKREAEAEREAIKSETPMSEEQANNLNRSLFYYNLKGDKANEFLNHVERVSNLNRETEAFGNELLNHFGDYLEGWGGLKIFRNASEQD